MHGEPGTLPLKRLEFKGDNGDVYIYDYSLIKVRQMKMAEAVYKYQVERKQKVAGSLSEAFNSGIHDYDQFVLSFLLLKESHTPKGEKIIEPFPSRIDLATWEESENYLFVADHLGEEHEEKLQQVIDDFFLRPSRYMLGFAVRGNILSAFTQNRQNLSALEQTIQPTADSSNSNDSSNETSSSDESSSQNTTTGTGS